MPFIYSNLEVWNFLESPYLTRRLRYSRDAFKWWSNFKIEDQRSRSLRMAM